MESFSTSLDTEEDKHDHIIDLYRESFPNFIIFNTPNDPKLFIILKIPIMKLMYEYNCNMNYTSINGEFIIIYDLINNSCSCIGSYKCYEDVMELIKYGGKFVKIFDHEQTDLEHLQSIHSVIGMFINNITTNREHSEKNIIWSMITAKLDTIQQDLIEFYRQYESVTHTFSNFYVIDIIEVSDQLLFIKNDLIKMYEYKVDDNNKIEMFSNIKRIVGYRLEMFKCEIKQLIDDLLRNHLNDKYTNLVGFISDYLYGILFDRYGIATETVASFDYIINHDFCNGIVKYNTTDLQKIISSICNIIYKLKIQ